MRKKNIGAKFEERIEERTQNFDGAMNELKAIRDRLSLLSLMSKEGIDAVVTQDGPLLLGGAQSSLVRSEARYRHLVNKMTALVVELTQTGNVVYINDTIKHITGYSAAKLTGSNWFDLLMPINESTSPDMLRQQFLESPELRAFMTHINTKNDDMKIISWNSAHIHGTDNSIERLIFFGTELTKQAFAELTQTERQTDIKLQEAELLKQYTAQQERQNRLASIGTLAGGIAHDFNNSMGMLMGYVDLLIATTEESRTTKILHSMMQVLNRSTETVSKLKNLGSNTNSRTEWLCLATLLHEECKLLRGSFDNVKLSLLPIQGYSNVPQNNQNEKEFCSSLYGVIGDKSAFSQVLTNLCINAAKHAFPGRNDGHIQLKLERIEGEQALSLQISDNGCGISSDILDQIYEPYITTGSEEESSGLGLFMVKGIVTRMGGHIECESELGKGTVFTITLPVTDSCNNQQLECFNYCVNAIH